MSLWRCNESEMLALCHLYCYMYSVILNPHLLPPSLKALLLMLHIPDFLSKPRNPNTVKYRWFASDFRQKLPNSKQWVFAMEHSLNNNSIYLTTAAEKIIKTGLVTSLPGSIMTLSRELLYFIWSMINMWKQKSKIQYIDEIKY